MYSKLGKFLEKPALYEKTKTAFWDDEHISKQMLSAHLDPLFEGASRKRAFIEASADWIKSIVPPSDHPFLLDIGCGPGIYAELFTKAGYSVTGVDFSRRSVEYACRSAKKQNLDITYLYQDYLYLDVDKKFDLCTMIYCDYGALSETDRQIVMEKVYQNLNPGGNFLLDVFSAEKFSCFEERQIWENCCRGGFWSEDAYAALFGFYKYADHVTLDQTVVISDLKTEVYYLWNTYFTKDLLMKEAEQAGFKTIEVYSDVCGAPYSEHSHTIAVLLEK